MFKQFGFAHFSIFGTPYLTFCDIFASQTKFPAYLARNDILVTAVSVREYDSSCVLQKPHMNAVVATCFVVRLVVGPVKAFFDSNFIRSSAPNPLSFAVALGAAGPVIQIVLPIN